MRVELKNVKHSNFASQETFCFEATVYIDGVRAGTVENDGRGGCHRWSPWSVEKQVAEIAKSMPKYKDETIEVADQLVNDIILRFLTKRDAVRTMKTCLFFEKNDGTLGQTTKLTEQQRLNVSNPTWAANALQKLGGKRFITDVDEIVDFAFRVK